MPYDAQRWPSSTRDPAAGLDYLALVDPATLRDVPADFAGTALLAVAARVGTTRLIDNAVVDLSGAGTGEL